MIMFEQMIREEKTKEQLNTFEKLDTNSQIIVHIIALYYNGISDWDLLKLLGTIPEFSLKIETLKALRTILKKLQRKSLIKLRKNTYTCTLQLSNILTRQIDKQKYYPAIQKYIFAKSENPVFWNEVFSWINNRVGFIRSLRFALFHKPQADFSAVCLAAKKLDDFELSSFIKNALNPFDKEWLDSLELETQKFLAYHIVQQTLFQKSTSSYFVWSREFLLKNTKENPVDFLAFEKICQGKLKEARTILTGNKNASCQNMLLGLDYLEQKSGTKEIFAENLKQFKKENRKRKDFFRDIGGAFYGIQLLVDEEKELYRLFGYPLKHDLPFQLESLYNLLQVAASYQETGAFSYEDSYFLRKTRDSSNDPITSFFSVLVYAWFDRKLLSTDILLPLHIQYREKGLMWFVAETAIMLKEIGHQDLVEPALLDFFKRNNLRSLTELITPKEEWEQTLDILLREFQAPPKEEVSKPEKTKRLIWLFNVYSKGGVVLTPKEQVRSKHGKWSKGRTVATKRLSEEWMAMDFLSEQDKMIAAGIKAEASYYGYYGAKEYNFDIGQALQFLIEHPLIFSDDKDRHPITLHKREPKLDIKKGRGGYTIQISPKPEGASYILKEEADYVYGVTIFTEEQLKLARTLGTKFNVPTKGKKHVERVMQHLSPIISVQSNVKTEQEKVEKIVASDKLLVQLFAFGEGLKIELRIRPFGEKGVFVRPGEGQKILVSHVQGKTLQVERNLKKEKKHRQKLVDNCPSLLFLDDENTGIVDDLQTCLEMLTEVQEIQDSNIQVEWPKGKAIRLQKAEFDDFSIQIQKKNQWFEASGELILDDKLALDINQIFELLAESRNQFIQLGDGEFLALTKQLRQRLDELRALTDQSGSKKRRFHGLSALAVQSVLTDFETCTFDKHWKQLQKNWAKLETKKYTLPSTFRGELRNYQQEGFLWLSRLADLELGACLADDMGLGKTIQVLAFLLSEAVKGPILVVSPSSVCLNWESEVLKFTPTLNTHRLKTTKRKKLIDSLGAFDVLICSYGLMQSESKNLQKKEWQCIVLDEAHSIKNAKTKRSKAIMTFQAKTRIALTGTPIQNHLGEIWNLFAFLNPGMLGSEGQFNQKFNNNDDTQAKKHLNKQLKPFLLRRTKNQVLQELPAKTEIVLTIEPSKEEKALYEALRLNALQSIQNSDKPAITQVLKELTTLRLACCHPKLVQSELELQSSKIVEFLELVGDLIENGHKILVFSQFVKYLSIIREHLDKKEIKYQYFDGSTSQKERKKRIDAFQAGEGDIFLISLKSGGVGINLTAADYVIHMDPWWNPAIEDQASDRAHRIGQKRPVTVYRLIMQHSIEEKIVKLHDQKREIAEDLLDGSGTSGKLTMKELMEMLNETPIVE